MFGRPEHCATFPWRYPGGRWLIAGDPRSTVSYCKSPEKKKEDSTRGQAKGVDEKAIIHTRPLQFSWNPSQRYAYPSFLFLSGCSALASAPLPPQRGSFLPSSCFTPSFSNRMDWELTCLPRALLLMTTVLAIETWLGGVERRGEGQRGRCDHWISLLLLRSRLLQYGRWI